MSTEIEGYKTFGDGKKQAGDISSQTHTEITGYMNYGDGVKENTKLLATNNTELQAQPWNTQMKDTKINLGKETGSNSNTNMKWSKQFNFLIFKMSTGTMMPFSKWVEQQHAVVRCIDAVLRGCGQVFLMNNPLTGLFMLIGIAVHSWQYLCCGLLGIISSTLTAYALKLDSGPIQAGLYGYNGILCGVAIAVFSYGIQSTPQLIFPVVFAGSLSTVFTVALGNITVALLGIPPLTFPFQLVTWLWLLACQGTFTYYPNEFPSPAIATLAGETFDGPLLLYNAVHLAKASMTSVSQVYLIDDYRTGILFVIGIGLASPIASLFAVLGSVVSIFISLGFGVTGDTIYGGLMGYNGVLTSLCIGGLFYVLSWEVTILSIFAACCSVMMTAGVGAYFSPVGMPALTFPFTLTTWFFILIGNSTKAFLSVPLQSLTLPENHLARYRSSKLVIDTICFFIGDSSLFNIVDEKDLQRIEKDYYPSLMCLLAANGSLDKIKETLYPCVEQEKLSRMSTGDYDGRTPLMLAAANGRLNVMKYIISLGVDVNKVDILGETALNDAIRSKSIAATSLLVQNGAILKECPKVSEDFIFAASRNEVYDVNLLMLAGINVDVVDENHRSALHLACANGNVEVVSLLLSASPSQQKDKFGKSPKDDAIINEHSEVVHLFKEYEEGNFDKETPRKFRDVEFEVSENNDHFIIFQTILLCSAAMRGEEMEVRKLVTSFEERSNLNSVDDASHVSKADYDDRIPLHHAAAHDNVDIIDILIRFGTSVHKMDRWNRTPLWEAILNDRREAAANLLTYDAVVSLSDQQCFQYMYDLLRMPYSATKWSNLTLARGFNINATSYDGQTALHIAVLLDKFEPVRQLLSLGIDMNKQDRWGNSALSLSSNAKISELLQ